jgi:hypothetical protein
VALREAIDRFVEGHDRGPGPFARAADRGAIAEKVRRGYHAPASMGRPAS